MVTLVIAAAAELLATGTFAFFYTRPARRSHKLAVPYSHADGC